MLTRHLFALAHFHVLHKKIVFFFGIFPTLADDTHIFDPTSPVPFTFDHFSSKLALVGLVVQPRECTP
jgi:hypothetical protein